jgi:enamine deaminase RidA (YjgF/YER057c/UK114 family)
MMAGKTEVRLHELGIELPVPSAPAANYVPTVIAGQLLFVSGQQPIGPMGLAFAGKIGREFDVEAGKQAARLSAINILAQAKAALGDLDRIRRVARVTGFIHATDDFDEPHIVLNGASDFFVEVLGERGWHSRTVLVAANLPMSAATLIDAIMEID